MSTDKIGLITIEQFMSGYQPVYQPIYPLFLGKSQAYAEEVGKTDLRRLYTVGDIRGKHITPKDTELRQISANDSRKSFRRYFLSNQFQISHMQAQLGVEDVIAQVLDEHQTQLDELFLLGEGTDATSMLNNSLFWSADPNYVLKSSAAIAAVGGNYLLNLHAKILENTTEADRVAGRKLIIFYGTSVLPLYNGLHATVAVPFKKSLQEVLGPNYTLAQLPPAITPSGANGWIVVNLDQVKTHYTVLPSLKDQGSNDEKMYYWFNFLMGSCMLEVLANYGIIRQPITLA